MLGLVLISMMIGFVITYVWYRKEVIAGAIIWKRVCRILYISNITVPTKTEKASQIYELYNSTVSSIAERIWNKDKRLWEYIYIRYILLLPDIVAVNKTFIDNRFKIDKKIRKKVKILVESTLLQNRDKFDEIIKKEAS